jgi:hypothetical protein
MEVIPKPVSTIFSIGAAFQFFMIRPGSANCGWSGDNGWTSGFEHGW